MNETDTRVDYLQGQLFARNRQLHDTIEHADNLTSELATLTAERDELLATVDAYPKTADGVTVTPDMDLWCWVPGHFGHPGPYILKSGIAMGNAPCVPWTECYSTEAAAKAAKEVKDVD